MTNPPLETFTAEIVALARGLQQLTKDSICCGNLSIQQYFLMQDLAAAPSSNSSLAKKAGSSPSAMTRLVDGIIQQGWADRRSDKNDRRRSEVFLTKEGRLQSEKLEVLGSDSFRQIFEKIAPEKRAQVIESLSILHGLLDGLTCC